ncbi:hypothetical protein ACHAXN_011394 [Cyclotella atomus]
MAMETATKPDSAPNSPGSNDDDDALSSCINSSSNAPQEMHQSKEAEIKYPLECDLKPCSVTVDHDNNDESINQDGRFESEAVSNVPETKDIIVDSEVMASTGEQLESGDECKTAQHDEDATVEAASAPLEDLINAKAVDAPQDSSQNQSSSDNSPIGVNDSAPTINESISIEEGDFVAIELLESTNNGIRQETRDTNDERAVLLDNDELHPHDTAATAPNTTTNNTAVLPTPQNKIRKKLNHPLLTPLTKLPWDRLATAAVSCDLLFNCKYSMRQVEDEVREEKKTIQYELHDEEECGEDCNVQELGLHCCSMLDDSEEEGERRSGNNMGEEQQQQQQTAVQNRGDLLVKEEQNAKSWRGSNPSLDMVFYKKFLDE